MTTTSATTKPDNGIPAFLDRAKTPRKPSEVPQPKLAHGNNGPHSKKAVEDNAKAAAALKGTAATPAKGKAAKGKAVVTKTVAKPSKGSVVVKGRASAASYAGKKIVAKVKLAEAKLRPDSGRYAMLAYVLKAKTSDDVLGKVVKAGDGRDVTIRGENLKGMLKRGHIELV